MPLPLIPEKYGIRLPHERHCLTAVNFQLIPEVCPSFFFFYDRSLRAQNHLSQGSEHKTTCPRGDLNKLTRSFFSLSTIASSTGRQGPRDDQIRDRTFRICYSDGSAITVQGQGEGRRSGRGRGHEGRAPGASHSEPTEPRQPRRLEAEAG